jgi:hypothetical protein
MKRTVRLAQWTIVATAILLLFWVAATMGGWSPDVRRLTSSVHGPLVGDYRAESPQVFAPLSPAITKDASQDQASAGHSRPLPGATPSGAPTPSASGSGPTPTGSGVLPTLPIPTPTGSGVLPTLPIPTPTAPVVTPTLPAPTPPPTPTGLGVLPTLPIPTPTVPVVPVVTPTLPAPTLPPTPTLPTPPTLF